MSTDFGLKRVLGLGGLLAVEIGTTVGAGIFSLTALAVRFTGPSVPLAFAAAAVPIIFIMMVIGMLGSTLPTAGGTYRYPSRLFSPRWATVGVWCYALGLILGALPLYATQCVHYLTALGPETGGLGTSATPLFSALAAAGLLTFFYLLNIFGISPAVRVQTLMVVIFSVALLLFALWGIPGIRRENFEPLFSGGAAGFAVAACLLTFALQGSNSVIELGAEIHNPGRNIPLSLLLSIPLVTVLYILVAVTAVGRVDLSWWTSLGEEANLTQPARNFLPPSLFYFFVIGGAMLAFTTTINGTFMWATKSLLVLAADGILPERLARTGRWGTPTFFLTLLWAGSSAAVLLDGLGKWLLPENKIDPLKIFASYATIGGMIIFIPVMIAALLLPRQAPALCRAAAFQLKGSLLLISACLGILTSVLLILILLVELRLWVLPYLVWFGLGFLFYSWRKAKIEEGASPLSRRLEEDLAAMIENALALSTSAGAKEKEESVAGEEAKKAWSKAPQEDSAGEKNE